MSETPADSASGDAIIALYQSRELKGVVTAVESLAMPAYNLARGGSGYIVSYGNTGTQYPTTQNGVQVDNSPDSVPD
jgi:hypothetical protein